MAEPQTVADGKPRFRRIMLKLSGEALAPAQGAGIDLDALAEIAQEIKDVAGLGVELALVIGAGNILRGSEYEARGMDRSTADQMGMLGTVINALALQNALEHRPPLEMRRRLERLLAKLNDWTLSPEMLQRVRAVAILEQIGTPGAFAVLKALASEEVPSRQTLEAKAALKRLE